MRYLIIFVFSLTTLLACTTTSPQDDPGLRYLSHVVKYQGETLGLISGWYTGKITNWKIIEAENPGMNVNRIRIGDTILIPRGLLKREDPLPQSYIGTINRPVSTPKVVAQPDMSNNSLVDSTKEQTAEAEEIEQTESINYIDDSNLVENTESISPKLEEDYLEQSEEPREEETPSIQDIKERYFNTDTDGNISEKDGSYY